MTRRYWFPKHYADVMQRARVTVGFVLAGAFAWMAEPSAWSLAVGLPVCLVGILLRAWAAGHLAKNERLATSGPFAWTRNPLYLGTLIVALGLVIAAKQVVLALLFAAAFLLVYLPAIELEEQHLRQLFPDYDEYARQVPLLVPRAPARRGDGRFQWALYYRNQEYQALIGFLAGAAWLAWRASL